MAVTAEMKHLPLAQIPLQSIQDRVQEQNAHTVHLIHVGVGHYHNHCSEQFLRLSMIYKLPTFCKGGLGEIHLDYII